MAGNPRIVTEDVTFTWDGATQRLPRGQVIDVPAGSALETAIGLDHLAPLAATAAQPAAVAEDAQDGPEDEGDAGVKGSGKSRRSAAQDSGEDKSGGDAM